MQDQQNQQKSIEHLGKVIYVEGDRIDVQMTVESACSACRAKKACGMEESEDKIVSLLTASAGQYSVGEDVMVFIEQRKGIKAAVYAYMIPFFIILAVLLVMSELGYSDGVKGLGAIGAVVVYYIVLRFFRHRIEKDLIFKLRKL